MVIGFASPRLVKHDARICIGYGTAHSLCPRDAVWNEVVGRRWVATTRRFLAMTLKHSKVKRHPRDVGVGDIVLWVVGDLPKVVSHILGSFQVGHDPRRIITIGHG
jgi:hypothetical protein